MKNKRIKNLIVIMVSMIMTFSLSSCGLIEDTASKDSGSSASGMESGAEEDSSGSEEAEDKASGSDENQTEGSGSVSGAADDAEEDGTNDDSGSGELSPEISECCNAFADYLSSNGLADGAHKFSLIYIDHDDYPELVYCETPQWRESCPDILCYKDGTVHTFSVGGTYGYISYLEKKNVLLCSDSHLAHDYEKYYAINKKGTDAVLLCSHEGEYDLESGNAVEPQYSKESFLVGNDSVTKDKNNAYLNKLTGGAIMTVWSADSAAYTIDGAGLENLRSGKIQMGK